METQLPLPQRGTAPQFSAHICCGQMAGRIKMPLGMEVSLGPGDFVFRRLCVRWGSSSILPKKEQSPQFSAYVYCGQTARWIKMTLGMEVGLGPGHTVLDGDPTPPKRAHPQFSAHVYFCQTAVCIRIPLGTEVGLGPGDCVRWGSSSP